MSTQATTPLVRNSESSHDLRSGQAPQPQPGYVKRALNQGKQTVKLAAERINHLEKPWVRALLWIALIACIVFLLALMFGAFA